MPSDDRIPISEFSTPLELNNNDVTVIVQDVNGVKTTFKVPLTLLATHLLKVMQFASDLETTTKTIIGAINELAGGTGGASSLGELTDVTITSPSTGQVLTYDATTGKWVNGAGAELAVTGEVIGSICSFNDGADNQPLKSWKTTITPIQAGSGTPSPSNVRSLSGRTQVVVTKTKANLLGGSKLLANAQAHLPEGTTDIVNKTFTFAANETPPVGTSFSSDITFKENTRYTLIFTVQKNTSGTGSNIRIRYTDGNQVNLSVTNVGQKETIVYTTASNKTIMDIRKYSGSATTTLYYDESGVFEGIVTAADFKAYDADSRTISLGASVFGGELDIKNGGVVVDHDIFTFDGSENWSATDTHIFRLITTGNNWLPVNAANWLKGYLSNMLQTDTRATGATSDKLPDHSFYITSQYLYVRCDEYDLAGFETALGTNNLQIYAPKSTTSSLTTQGEAFSTSEGINQFYTDCGISDVVYFNGMVDDIVDICNEVIDSKVKVLTGTLTAGNTTITFTDNSLTSDCTKTLYVDDAFFGVAPTAMTTDYANHSVTYTFPVQASNMPVKLEVK